MKNIWVLYDGRYYTHEIKAIVYCTANSHSEAIRDKVEDFNDAVIVMYDVKGNYLVNARIDYEAMNEAERKIEAE